MAEQSLQSAASPAAARCEASPSHEAAFGVHPQDIVGKHALELIHPEDHSYMVERLSELTQGSIYLPPVEFRYRHRHGHWIFMEARGTPIIEDEQITRVIVIARDIGVRKQQEEMIQHMANHDFLTGLPNRRFMLERLEAALKAAERDHKLAVM